MASCLNGGGVAADTGEGEYAAIVVLQTDLPYRVCSESGTCESSGGADSGEMTEEEWRQLAEKFDTMAQPYLDSEDGSANMLFVGENDFTDLYRNCLSTTGYEAPGITTDTRNELTYKGKVAEAGVKWADCARRNGYPATTDPASPVADNYQTIPAAVAPFSMSVDQLRELLSVCPNVDLEAHRAQEEAMTDPLRMDTEIPEVYDPIITFDFPGWAGKAVDASALDESTLAKLQEFQTVMDAAATAALASINE